MNITNISKFLLVTEMALCGKNPDSPTSFHSYLVSHKY